MLIIVCFGDLWFNKVSISFLQQLDLFGINGLKHSPSKMPHFILFFKCKNHFFPHRGLSQALRRAEVKEAHL